LCRQSIPQLKQAIYKLFAAYIHTIPLEELIESVERARLDAKLRYVVIYGAGAAYGSGPDPTERLPDKQLLSRLALEPQRISGISLFRGRDKREQSEKLDELVVAWGVRHKKW
jgi:hypothetical protein